MRLIDADSLKKWVEEYHTSNWGIPQDELIYAIGSAQTIDPVKHGMWMHDKDDCLVSGYCSVCGWQSIICETDVADMPFCPNCGAKMDGREGCD